jgi:SepF-like predicted cell division protein (DUF552 family)
VTSVSYPHESWRTAKRPEARKPHATEKVNMSRRSYAIKQRSGWDDNRYYEKEAVQAREGRRSRGPLSRSRGHEVAEIYRYEDLGNLTENLYAGNMLIVDYESISNDEPTLKRIIADLKAVAQDTGGDVAGIGKHMLIATPGGFAVDRNKIKGSY